MGSFHLHLLWLLYLRLNMCSPNDMNKMEHRPVLLVHPAQACADGLRATPQWWRLGSPWKNGWRKLTLEFCWVQYKLVRNIDTSINQETDQNQQHRKSEWWILPHKGGSLITVGSLDNPRSIFWFIVEIWKVIDELPFHLLLRIHFTISFWVCSLTSRNTCHGITFINFPYWSLQGPFPAYVWLSVLLSCFVLNLGIVRMIYSFHLNTLVGLFAQPELWLELHANLQM